jgi:hypothetical protein
VATPLALPLWLAVAAAGPSFAAGGPVPETHGRIEVQASCYGGLVAVDRQDRGHVPTGPMAVLPGFHVVELTCPGAKRTLRLVYVSLGETLVLEAQVSPGEAERGPGGRVDRAPKAATVDDDAPVLHLAGRADLAAVVDGDAGLDRLAVSQFWRARYGPRGENAYSVAGQVDARHPVDGAARRRETGSARVAALEVASPRSGGLRGRLGRRVLHMPYRDPARLDGGGVDLERGPLRLEVAAGFDADSEPRGRLGTAMTSAGAMVSLTGEKSRQSGAAALVAESPRLGGWGLDGRATASETGADGGMLRLAFDGASFDASVSAAWRQRDAVVGPRLLAVNRALVETSAGGVGEVALLWRSGAVRSHLAASVGDLGACGEIAWLAHAGPVRAGVAADALSGAQALPDRRRLVATIERGEQIADGLGVMLRLGREHVVYPEGARRSGLSARADVRVPIGRDVTVTLGLEHGATDVRRPADARPAGAGPTTVAALGLELR